MKFKIALFILFVAIIVPNVHAQVETILNFVVGFFEGILIFVVESFRIILRTFGIRTGIGGPVCSPILSTLTSTLNSVAGSNSTSSCSCEILALSRFYAYCNPVQEICFESFQTDGSIEEYCGTNDKVDIYGSFAPFSISISEVYSTSCWSYKAPDDGSSIRNFPDVCITSDTDGDLETVLNCTVSVGSDTDSCDCTPCNDAQGIEITCGSLDLDPSSSGVFNLNTECVGYGGFGPQALIDGIIDENYVPFLQPLN